MRGEEEIVCRRKGSRRKKKGEESFRLVRDLQGSKVFLFTTSKRGSWIKS